MSKTPLRTNDEVIMASARLKRATPNLFTDFETAFMKLAAEKMVACVNAPADGVLRAQGAAQFAAELQKLFADCVTDADQLERKMRGQ